MIKLYALKCRGGYIKNSSEQGCRCVPLSKASVFNDPGSLEDIVHLAVRQGITDIKRIELTIMERDYSPFES